VNAVALGGDFIVSGSNDYTLILWNLGDPRTHLTLGSHSARIRAVSCTADGCFAISGSADGALIRWDLRDGTSTVLRASGAGIKALTMLPHGCLAVSGADDGTLMLWNVESGRLLQAWSGHSRRVDA